MRILRNTLLVFNLIFFYIYLSSCSKDESVQSSSASGNGTISASSKELFVINDTAKTLSLTNSYQVTQNPSHGSISFDSNGDGFYSADTNYVGSDLAILQSDSAQVTVTLYVFARPNFDNVPTDTYLKDSYQNLPEYWWGLTDIQANLAWNTHTNCIDTNTDSIRIGIIDSGIDHNHPDLVDNLDNALRKNFIADNTNTMDDNGHGTHVAGIIAAKAGNSTFSSGVCWQAKIVALKALDSSGNGELANIISAINYARQNNIKITNNSYGFLVEDSEPANWEDYLFNGSMASLSNAIKDSRVAGHLFITASGNDGLNNNTVLALPANYAKFTGATQTDNVISVAAITPVSTLASFSNYGNETVNIAAPGYHIVSTALGNSTTTAAGTSAAAPFVSGTAALLWSNKLSANANPTYQNIKEAIIHTDSVESFTDGNKIWSNGKINIPKAITKMNELVPDP